MPDLTEKFSHLEALRESHEQAVAADPTNPRPTGEYWRELIRCAPWLIPLAQQAEKLAAVLSDMVTGKELTRHMFLNAEEEDAAWEYFRGAEKAANKLLAEFEAIKKEAENGA